MKIKRIDDVLHGAKVSHTQTDFRPQHYRFYTATIKLRRGPGWHVKPECESTDGMRVLVSVGWQIDEEGSIYFGEYAMIVEDAFDLPMGWVASGDLVDWQEAERPERRAAKHNDIQGGSEPA